MFYLITKPDCPWCDKAFDLLTEKGVGCEAYLYTEHKVITKLMFKAGLKTVPQIWHNSEYIGGYDDLVEWFAKNES